MESPEKSQINNLDADAEITESKSNPEERSGIYIQGFLKITDPESGDILLETRA